jgi:hypothetical protein
LVHSVDETDKNSLFAPPLVLSPARVTPQLIITTFDGVIRDYLLQPWHLVAYHGNYYPLALNTDAGRTETFALSRCRSLAGTGQHFPSPAAFDPKAFLKNAFGSVGAATQHLTIRSRRSVPSAGAGHTPHGLLP